jgi:hypothetical protein
MFEKFKYLWLHIVILVLVMNYTMLVLHSLKFFPSNSV